MYHTHIYIYIYVYTRQGETSAHAGLPRVLEVVGETGSMLITSCL